MSWVWHLTEYDGEASGELGNVKYPFIAITPRSTIIWSDCIC